MNKGYFEDHLLSRIVRKGVTLFGRLQHGIKLFYVIETPSDRESFTGGWKLSQEERNIFKVRFYNSLAVMGEGHIDIWRL